MSKTAKDRTLEQLRAEHALEKIKEIKDTDYGHYVSYVSSLPATIVMNGLGQALAMLLAQSKSDKKDPHYFLYEHVASWLAKQIKELQGKPEEVIEKLMENSQDVYLQGQAEAMTYLHWLKQFARAYLREKEEGKEESNDQ